MKLGRQRRRVGTPILDLVEEAIALLRRAPAGAHLAYFAGAIPFWIGLLFFLSDMSQNAFAEAHVLDASLGVALLYVWKKAWQTASAAQLRVVLTGLPDAPWNLRRIWRVVAAQAGLQPLGLILRPIAGVLTIPVVWVSAFFQSVTIVGDGKEHKNSVLSRALEQAKLWPLQAHGIVSILTLFSFFVWVNVCVTLALGPYLLKTFFGIETEYTRNFLAYLNTTFFTASVALTSLAVDPLRKAVFVIRCFHGTALHTGDDITAELRQIRASQSPKFVALAAAALISLFMVSPLFSAESPTPKVPAAVDAEELEHRVVEVLQRREYAWHAPRPKEQPATERSWLARWFQGLGKKMKSALDAAFDQAGRLAKWLRGLFTTPNLNTGTTSIDWFGLAKAMAVLFASAAVVAIVWLLARTFIGKKLRVIATTSAVMVAPDLRAENLVANQLPEDGWRELAREYAARGELVLALRAAWLAGLAHLGQRELIGIARHKSNRDYGRELLRRARDRQVLLGAFDDNLRAFERSWYGKHEVSNYGYEKFEANLERIRTS